MRRAGMIVMIHLAVAALVALAPGCGAPEGQRAAGPMRVVATTTIVADLVRQVAGDGVEVVSLMGPGVDPHLYKPSAGDVRRFGEADLVVYSGLHLEGKMSELLDRMGQRGTPTVAVAECIPEDQLIRTAGFAGLHDPHVWFDVALWREAVGCVEEALVSLEPARGAGFGERAEAYRQELDELDRWVRQQVELLPPERRVLVTAHDAFAYFVRAYGFDVRGLLGVSTAAEAGTADVQALAAFLAEQKVPAVFVETSVPDRFVQALRQAAAARGHEVASGGTLYSDALGDPSGDAGTYVGTVRHNVATIVGALAGAS